MTERKERPRRPRSTMEINKVVTTMMIGLLDDCKYYVRSAFTYLGLWQKLTTVHAASLQRKKMSFKGVLFDTLRSVGLDGAWEVGSGPIRYSTHFVHFCAVFNNI